MRQWSVFVVLVLTLAGLGIVTWFVIGPWPHDSWLRTPMGNQEHGRRLLPQASMFQAADSCLPGHFYTDEMHGYWVQDFQMVLAGPSPERVFTELVRRPEPMAQAYGLAGLKISASDRFDSVLASYQAPETTLVVADSCQVRTQPMATVVQQIQEGYWTARLTDRRIDVH